jgi:ATP-dependent Clp protease ATP-binding subunit ClpB
MDLNRLTQKSQQAVQEAQTKALRYGHVEIDGEHLLLALLEQQDGLLPRLLARMEVPVASLQGALEQSLERRPRVSGPRSTSLSVCKSCLCRLKMRPNA